MNFRIIALASCVALGSIAFGGKAQAQNFTTPTDTVLTSTGTIAPSCTVSSVSPGSLTLDSTSKILRTIGGGDATFRLACNNAALVVVKSSTATGPAITATSDFTAVLTGATDAALTGTLAADSGAPIVTSTPNNFSNRLVSLRHTLTETSPNAVLTSGTYTFSTSVNITPQ